jgi:phosphoglycolate phosphatase-like HAD superfamily hydrolase
MEDLSDRIRRSESEILDQINDVIVLEEEIEEKIGRLNTLAVSYYSLLDAGAKSEEISVDQAQVAEFKRYSKEMADEIDTLYRPINGFKNMLQALKQKMPLAGPRK